MDGEQPQLQPPLHNRLRQVLGLGEELLSLAHRAVNDDTPAQETVARQGQQVIETAARLLDGQASLWLAMELLQPYTGKSSAQPLVFGLSHTGTAGRPDQPFTPLMQACLERDQVTCAENSQSDAFWSLETAAARETPGTALAGKEPPGTGLPANAAAAPLRLLDSEGHASLLLGILQIERPNGPPLHISEIELLEGLAIQAALGLQSSLRLIDERWRMRQLALVRQVSLQILDLRDLDEIARRITRLIQETFDFYYVALLTLEPEQDLLHFRASAGPAHLDGRVQSDAPAVRVCVGEGIIGHAAQTGQEVLARNVAEEPLYRHLDLLSETRSEVALPLMVQDRRLGVLDVQSDQVDDFDDIDMLVLRALAGNIAIALENAWLYGALSRHASQLEAVYAVSSAITSILDQDQLLNEVIQLIQSRFGYPYVHLYSVHPGRRKVFYEAGTFGHTLKQQGFAYDLDDPQGLAPWVARSGVTVLANDVSQEPRYRSSEVAPDETRSELVVPLVFGGEVLGVLDVHSDRLNAFGDEDRFLFEALADHIAIAMRNATLYRSELWRRRVSDSMREVAGLLSADADLDQVLEAILLELEFSLPLEVAAIWLLDEDLNQEDVSETPLHLAAVHGIGTAGLDLELGLTPEEVWEYNVAPANLPEHVSNGWLREALRAEQAVLRTGESPFEPLGAALGFPSDYSALAAPLRVGNQLLGLLVLAHRTSGRYGSEGRAMGAAFASYAAVAIENTRMYEAAHEQAWVSTVLLQVAEATQSQTNLNELLNTVIHITPMLAGVKACLLYIRDDDGDFLPAAATGLTSEQQSEFERWRFSPGEVAVLDHLVAEHHPIILGDNEDDQNLTAILQAGSADRPANENGLSVVVPLLARGDVLGAFVVNYSAGSVGISGKTLEAFFDERLAILQGIAHQTAVAVDNIRLLKLQKEEAYVSVALLQVAQAVVSSNDLDEALGSIVRITPILVGVKRALVYLWDDAHRAFHLAQAYGVPKAAEKLVYHLDEFPLLDAVLLDDALVAYPLWEDLSADENIPAAWAALEPPDSDMIDAYLENAACLLIAFPLSVKGKVLGVFLVEEPDSVMVEGFTGGAANRRLRNKRLEIITGISQQAALAIQNEQLQREMVEQERLEREMQLAREIQNAFLPEAAPELPGWDLRVRWRTAREVGGDFHDFFELPGNRLGLVIADVADKGMPAALFMVLVRTLVRATVQDIDSPAEVLERVNEVIVPEAPGGMFVTIFYAVLDLDTGNMEYANAGHNPPLLLHTNTCQIDRLERTGMALGVQEGNRMLMRKTTLECGDYLVLYTDGITEAFTMDGDFFGEPRLHHLITDAVCQGNAPQAEGYSAERLLNQIDEAVITFIGDAGPSDDLTLLVVKRNQPEGAV